MVGFMDRGKMGQRWQVVEPAFRLQQLLRRRVVGLRFWAQREEDLRRRFNAIQRGADAHGVQGDW
jgi:hypothetical protein